MSIFTDIDKVSRDVFALPIDALGDYLDRLEAEIIEGMKELEGMLK